MTQHTAAHTVKSSDPTDPRGHDKSRPAVPEGMKEIRISKYEAPPLPKAPDLSWKITVKDTSESAAPVDLTTEFARLYPQAKPEQLDGFRAALAALKEEWKKYKRDDKGGPIDVTLSGPDTEPPYHGIEITGMTLIPVDAEEETRLVLVPIDTPDPKVKKRK